VIEVLERELHAAWPELVPGRAAPERLHIAKLSQGDYPCPDAALVVHLFADRDAQPIAVAKVARVAAGDAAIRCEADALRRLPSRLPADLAATVPQLWRAGEVNERAFLICSFMPGAVEMHHTWSAPNQRRAAPHLAAAMSWARRVAVATANGSITGARWLGCEPQAARDALERCGCGAAIRDRFETRLAPLWSQVWPACLAHGDYFPGNILFAPGRRLGIVDWAPSEDPAPVFWDALTYELSFGLHAAQRDRPLDPRLGRGVHELPAFAAARRDLESAGVPVGLGSAARLAVILRGLLRDATGAPSRLPLTVAWARLLAAEID